MFFEYLICTKHYEYYKDINNIFKKAATKYGISNSHHRTGFVGTQDSDRKVMWNIFQIMLQKAQDTHSYGFLSTFYLVSNIGEGNGTPLRYFCLENPMEGGSWQAAVHGVARSRTGLRDFTFTLHFHALEKEMATHSSVLAWRIPGTGKPGGLLSMRSHRIRHD